MLADSSQLAPNRDQVLEALRHKVQAIEGLACARHETVSTGSAVLDRLLPAGGLQRGTLVEWLTKRSGAGSTTLALLAAREASKGGELVVVGDSAHQFYAPAALALGIAPQQLVILRPTNEADAMWALDQALRCPGVAAVWAHLPRLAERDFRRLQLAAEEGGALGLLGRPARARGQPSWAELQLLIEPIAAGGNRRLRVEVLRARGGVAGASLTVEIDDITGEVREAPHERPHPLLAISRVAAPAARRRQA
jgi:protein ImuA